MIKKLQMKLVIAAMLSLLVVLTVIIGTAAALDYRKIVTEADQTLQLLAENGDVFPENLGKHMNMRGFAAEMPYEARYFSVTLAGDDTVEIINTGRIAAVDAAQAAAYAEEIIDEGNTRGFIGQFRYYVYRDAEGVKHICFLLRYRELSSFYSFLRSSVLVSAVGSLAVLVLLIILSRRIVKPVAESYEKQKRFITDAGHELKTPLTIISADTEILEMDYGESEWLDDIRSQTERLTGLTNQLVYLARMEEQPKMEQTDFSLSDAVQEAVDDFTAVAQQRGKTLTAEIEPQLSMRGEEKSIRRLIAIFLDNAVKYTEDGGHIRLSLDRWRGQLRLRVYNTTEHIDREALPHLFDRFYRTDQSRNSKSGGYGLGLSIAAAIAAAHHGKITAGTADEQSLVITVTFPDNKTR